MSEELYGLSSGVGQGGNEAGGDGWHRQEADVPHP